MSANFGSNNISTTGSISTGSLTINNAFTLPTSDGSANQVLQTDGFGSITWASVSAVGNTYVSSASFNVNYGELTLTLNDSSTVSVDLDGRYLTSHPSISAASSSDNSGRTYIQDIILDSNGHVTGITTATETVVDTDTNYYLNGITKSGNTLTFSVNGTTNQTYTFGSNAFTSYTDHSTQGYLTDITSESLGDLSDVSINTPANNQVLAYSTAGSGGWINKTFDISLIQKGSVPLGGYSNTQMGYYYSWNVGTEAVVNEQGNDIDFRVEGNTDSDLLLVDAGNDRVQIGKLNINNAFTFPTADGSLDQVLQTDGAGNVSWGSLATETSHADVVVDGDFTSTGLMKRGASSGTYSIVTDNSANWNTAYGWGDHGSVGYLTSHPTISAASSSNNSGRTYIQDILLDSNGHVTGITTATETVTDTNTYVSSASFNINYGTLTLTMNDASTVEVDLDGRYATSNSSTNNYIYGLIFR